LDTVAVNGTVAVIGMIPLGGVIPETVIAGTVKLVVKEFVVLVTGVAVTFTVKSLDDSGGAVYVVAAPLDVEVGAIVPHGAGEHDTDHVTPPLLKSFATVPVNF
jgi:hypothetical protein